MATTLNPSDIALEATSPRLITVSLANNLLFSGNVTGTVNGVQATDITNAISNFNTSNDQISTAITNPAASTITHTTNDDGSVNITFNWTWAGTEATIDGFIIVSIARTSSGNYSIGTSTQEETAIVVPASKRAHVFYGVASNRYFTFAVRAYRRVATNINALGIITSSLSQNTTPYQPSSSVALNVNNITTTQINSTALTNYQNNQISLSGLNGSITINNAGGGTVTGVVMPGNQITTGNVSTYIASGAIGNAYIGNLSASKITTGTLDAGLITVTNLNAGSITTGTLNAGLITVTNLNAGSITTGTLNANLIGAGTINSVTLNSGAINAGSYSTYAWPGSGSGAHLSASGLLVGNFNGGQGFLEFNAVNGSLYIGKGGATKLALNTAGDLQVYGRVTTQNGVQFGDDIVAPGHYGLTLNSTNYTSVFMKRNDGVIFFRVNTGLSGEPNPNGQNGLSFNSQDGVLYVYGDVIATGNIKALNVTETTTGESGVGASSYTLYFSIPSAGYAGALIDYNIGPDYITSFSGGEGGKYGGGAGTSFQGPVLTGLSCNGIGLQTIFVPAAYLYNWGIGTGQVTVSRNYFNPGTSIKVSITLLKR